MTPHLLFSLAFHAYSLAAIAYLVHLIRPWRPLSWVARGAMAVGLVLHGVGLVDVLSSQGGMPRGLVQGFSVVSFLLLALGLGLDLRYRLPTLGAFLAPGALLVWAPALWLRDDAGSALSPEVRRQVLPVHIGTALIGVAAFAAAVLVGGLYLLMERQMKGKRFGLWFTRLPSLQVLDDVNHKLILGGFVALSLTLITGAFFVNDNGPFWAWHAKEIGTVLAWCMFAGLLTARVVAGWRGRRVVLLTLVGFAFLLVCFFGSYSYDAAHGVLGTVP